MALNLFFTQTKLFLSKKSSIFITAYVKHFVLLNINPYKSGHAIFGNKTKNKLEIARGDFK